ncbi:hypothetical protein DRN93_05550, partial [archaeon]
MPANRKRHDAYGIYVANDAMGQTITAIHRATSLSVTTDTSVDGIMEIANEGMVEWKADVPVTTVSVGGNQIAKMIDESNYISPLHWLGLLAGQDAVGADRVKVFVIGDPKDVGAPGSTEETSMFDIEKTPANEYIPVTCDFLIPIRGASALEAVAYIANLATTSLSLSFSVDGYAEWSADLEADNKYRFQDTNKTATVVSLTADSDSLSLAGLSNPPAGSSDDEVLLVFLNGEKLTKADSASDVGSASQGYRRWFYDHTTKTITFSTGLINSGGDYVRVVYRPGSAPTWSTYELVTGPDDQGAIRRGELDIYLITDTTSERIVEG